MNQLLPFDHEFLNSFVRGLEVRGMFLDILKAFEKEWHDGLIFNCFKML